MIFVETVQHVMEVGVFQSEVVLVTDSLLSVLLLKPRCRSHKQLWALLWILLSSSHQSVKNRSGDVLRETFRACTTPRDSSAFVNNLDLHSRLVL